MPRVIWGILFMLSIAFLLVYLLVVRERTPTSAPSAAAESQLVVIASLLTAIVTFLGFISTTILGWRKEQRDARAAELERARQQVELERAKLEVEKLKAEKAAWTKASGKGGGDPQQ